MSDVDVSGAAQATAVGEGVVGAASGAGDTTGTTASMVTGTSTEVTTNSMTELISAMGEDYTGNPTLSKFNSTEDLAKSYIDLQKLVGKKVERIPDNTSTPEDVSEFYGKLGIAVEDNYSVTLPEGLSSIDGANERLEGALAMAREAGLSDYQATKFFNSYLESDAAEGKAFAEQQAAANEAAVESLKTEWGNGYDGVISQVKTLEQKLGIFEDFESSGLNNNPILIKALGKIAMDVGEKSSIDRVISQTPIGVENEISEVNSQIEDLLRKDQPIPSHLQSRLSELFQKG